MICGVCENMGMFDQLFCKVYCKYISKFKMVMTLDEVIPFLEIYSQEKIRKVFKDIYISLFISASLIRVKNGEQSTCPPIGNYLNEL